MRSERVIALFGTILLLLFFTTTVNSKTLLDLQKEETIFQSELTNSNATSSNRQQAQLLADAAVVLVEQEQCSPAVLLYKQAIRLGQTADIQFWQDFIKAASCAREWDEASKGAFLFYTLSNDPDHKAIALAEMALLD